VHKVVTASQSKSGNAWIYNTVCTGYTFGAYLLTLELALVGTQYIDDTVVPHGCCSRSRR
jgi:hypothetical protein